MVLSISAEYELFLNRSIQPTLTQNRLEKNDYEGMLHTPQIS